MPPEPTRAPDVVVIVPTYNEAENLAATTSAVLEAVPDAGVLVVDDSSPDGTGEIADDLARADPRIRVLHRRRDGGLGRAYLAGFAEALAGGAAVVVQIDADGSHPADRLPAMLGRLAADADLGLVIGSRWTPGGGADPAWGRHRRLLSRLANRYARGILRIPVDDMTAGFRAYRAAALESIDRDAIDSRGYCFQIDLTLRTWDAGWGIAEVPIEFRDRRAGRSKMSAGIVAEAMVRLTAWGIRRRLRPPRTARRQAAQRSIG